MTITDRCTRKCSKQVDTMPVIISYYMVCNLTSDLTNTNLNAVCSFDEVHEQHM